MNLYCLVVLVDTEFKPVVVQNRERQMTPLVGTTNTTFHRISFPPEHCDPGAQLIRPVFAFTDLSVRQEGHYHLKFSVYEIINGESVIRKEAFSSIFRVYPAKTFPGMARSTWYTDHIKKFGIRVRVSKSTRATKQRDGGVKHHEFENEIDIKRHLAINPSAAARYGPYEARVITVL